jgi:hypothetical protein
MLFFSNNVMTLVSGGFMVAFCHFDEGSEEKSRSRALEKISPSGRNDTY